MIKSMICMASGHNVNRGRVWHDGRNFRTKCTRCGTAMLRDRDGWRKFDADADQAEDRMPHPSQREMA